MNQNILNLSADLRRAAYFIESGRENLANSFLTKGEKIYTDVK
jgi:hypothetical protein